MNWHIVPQLDRKGNEVLIRVVKFRPPSAKERAEGDDNFKRIKETPTMLFCHKQNTRAVLKITAQEREHGWMFNLHEAPIEKEVEVRTKRLAHVTQVVPNETRLIKRSHGSCTPSRFFKLLQQRTNDREFVALVKALFQQHCGV